MVNKLLLSAGIALLSFSALAQSDNKGSYSQGATNGAAFQQLQAALEASSDALAAAVSANTSNIEANAAAIAAEEAARQAEDAAVLAKFAADLALEVLARMEADAELADALAAEELARMQGIDILGTRIDALEAGAGSLPGADFNEISYEETSEYEIADLRDDIFTLDYQAGEWLYMASTYAPGSLTSALCTSHPNAYQVLVAYAMNGMQNSDVTGSMTFVLTEGSENWVNASASMSAQPLFLRATALGMNTQLINWSDYGFNSESEISTASGFALGNIAVLRVSSDRMAACGF